jgi:hypothetical protein
VVEDVEGVHADPQTRLFPQELRAQPLELPQPPGTKSEVATAACPGPRHLRAEPGRGARDQDALPVDGM